MNYLFLIVLHYFLETICFYVGENREIKVAFAKQVPNINIKLLSFNCEPV